MKKAIYYLVEVKFIHNFSGDRPYLKATYFCDDLEVEANFDWESRIPTMVDQDGNEI